MVLRQVLEELGALSDQIQYFSRGKLVEAERFEGPVTTRVETPVSLTLPGMPVFTDYTAGETVEDGVQSVSRKVLRAVVYTAYEYLKGTHFRLLPQALELHPDPIQRILYTSQIVQAETDPCLRTVAHHLQEQDEFISSLEQRRRRDRARMAEVEDSLQKGTQTLESLSRAVTDLQLEMQRRDELHRAEIADLRDKIGDFGLRNDYLNSRVLGLQRRLDDKERALAEREQRSRDRGVEIST